jgi:RimJ/RimL family protein N-acetyltransferase
MGKLIPPVVAAGAMAEADQPIIDLDDELLLRPWQPTDVEPVIEAFTTPDIEHWHFRRFDTEDEAAGWIAECTHGWRTEKRATWAIVDRTDGAVVGRVAVFTELEDGHGEVSYWVLPRARGRGVATRACLAATRWAHDLGLHRIELQHSTRNEASGRVAVRCGFAIEGIRRGANLHDDGWHDMCLHSHLSTDPLPDPPPAPRPRGADPTEQRAPGP